MDIDNLIRGVILVSLLIAFVGIFFWAWSKKRTDDFELMSRLPLDDFEDQNNSQITKKVKR